MFCGLPNCINVNVWHPKIACAANYECNFSRKGAVMDGKVMWLSGYLVIQLSASVNETERYHFATPLETFGDTLLSAEADSRALVRDHERMNSLST
ncbi:hypothetical protein STEG23_021794 [Scotinomys teguina]